MCWSRVECDAWRCAAMSQLLLGAMPWSGSQLEILSGAHDIFNLICDIAVQGRCLGANCATVSADGSCWSAKVGVLNDDSANSVKMRLRGDTHKYTGLQGGYYSVGLGFMVRKIVMDDGTLVQFEIWDCGGRSDSRYNSLSPLYYRGSSVMIVCYNVGDSESFAEAQRWVQQLVQQGPMGVILLLLGTHDAQPEDVDDGTPLRRPVLPGEAEEFAQSYGVLHFETICDISDDLQSMLMQIGHRIRLHRPHVQLPKLKLEGVTQGSGGITALFGCCSSRRTKVNCSNENSRSNDATGSNAASPLTFQPELLLSTVMGAMRRCALAVSVR